MRFLRNVNKHVNLFGWSLSVEYVDEVVVVVWEMHADLLMVLEYDNNSSRDVVIGSKVYLLKINTDYSTNRVDNDGEVFYKKHGEGKNFTRMKEGDEDRLTLEAKIESYQNIPPRFGDIIEDIRGNHNWSNIPLQDGTPIGDTNLGPEKAEALAAKRFGDISQVHFLCPNARYVLPYKM
ncbi:unnamed protein product [Prunus armeniaca]|uniref:Uncharacterized protein n=1 Tax=Prunus armeniaca TaxID=36596 RepID=A0A6J5TU95_PRUAR|nr:unnamed protein product [Prunus armeniaca]